MSLPSAVKRGIFLCKITLKKKSDGSSFVFWIGSRSYHPGELYSSSPIVYSGLVSIDGLGFEMGEVLPVKRTGSIRIDNTRGTIAHDKRIGDYFDQYSIITSEIEVYSFDKPARGIGSVSDLTLYAKTNIVNGSIDPSANLVTFDVEAGELSNDLVGYTVTRDQFPFAKNASIGRTLPVVLGQGMEIIPLCLQEENFLGTNVDYAYASTFGDVFTNGGVNDLKVKLESGEYVTFNPVASATTPFLDFGLNSAGTGDWVDEIWEGQKEIGYKLKPGQNITRGTILTGVNAYFSPGVAPSFTDVSGEGFSLNVYEKAENGFPGRLIRSTFIELLNSNPHIEYVGNIPGYDSFNRHVYRFRFNLDKPVIIDDSIFCLIERKIANTTTWYRIVAGVNNTLPTFQRFLRFDPGSAQYDEDIMSPDFFFSQRTDGRECMEFFGVAFADSPGANNIDAKGRGVSKFSISRRDQINPSLSSLEFVANIDGLKDASDGRVTGSAGSQILRPHHAIRVFYAGQNGNSISGLTIPSSAISQVNAFSVRGETQPNATFRDTIGEILNNFSMKLIPKHDGELSLWAYGVTQSINDYRLTEQDTKVESIKVTGIESIVNEISVSFGRSGSPVTNQELQQDLDISGQFERSRSYSRSDSIALYGIKRLSESYLFMNWFRSESVAFRFKTYVFDFFGQETYILEAIIPFFKKNYKEMELFDIVKLSHPENPHGGGTSSENRTWLPRNSVDDQRVDGFINKFSWRKARTNLYRVLSVDPIISGREEEAELRIRLRMINKEREIF